MNSNHLKSWAYLACFRKTDGVLQKQENEDPHLMQSASLLGHVVLKIPFNTNETRHGHSTTD
jgi:hypothetical protein